MLRFHLIVGIAANRNGATITVIILATEIEISLQAFEGWQHASPVPASIALLCPLIVILRHAAQGYRGIYR